MDPFVYSADGTLSVDGMALDAIAERHGTPCYVYSAAAIEARYRAFTEAFSAHPHRICYAVKANGNVSILALLARLGAGFDIVSGGELERVLRAGGDASRTTGPGVGKSTAELTRALAAGIGCFNVESAGELERLASVAATQGVQAPVSLRVNPDVDARTHPYISTGLEQNKFGVPMREAHALYRQAADSPHLAVRGVGCHIGSQITDLDPLVDALERLLALVDTLAADGIAVEHVDVGGGLGVRYRDERPPSLEAYAEALLARLGNRGGQGPTLVFEPGRWLVAEAGVLLTRVEYVKRNTGRNFIVVDAGMNDLLRPALYDGWHEIDPVRRADAAASATRYDVVGPVCESADFLGRQRALDVRAGDVLAVRTVGAYGFVMASNYNARGRPAEILVGDGGERLIRRRETIEDQLAAELPPQPPASGGR